jgi:hypothetical protein
MFSGYEFQGNGIWYINMCASWVKLEDGKILCNKNKTHLKSNNSSGQQFTMMKVVCIKI